MKNWKRTFSIIWTGQFFSLLSSAVVNFAVILWLSIETRSASVLAMAAIAAILPQAVLALFTGVLIDRWDRKKVMIASDSFIAVCSLILAILFYTSKVEIWQIYTLLVFRSIGAAFHGPAMQASVPLLAPKSELTRIAGINQLINSASNIAGPALGGLLITFFDMAYVLMLDVVGAVLACTSLLFVVIPNPEKHKSKAPNILREFKEGISAITSNKGLKWLFIISVLSTFFIMPIVVLFPLMTLDHFEGDTIKMSIIEVAWGVGMLIGGAFLGIKAMKMNNVTVINASYIVLGLTLLLSGILPAKAYVMFVVLTAIGGVSDAVYNSLFMSVIQIKVEPSALGRVFSMYGSLNMLPSLVGIMATGLIASVIGVANAFIISGGVIVLLGIMSYISPSIKKLASEFKY